MLNAFPVKACILNKLQLQCSPYQKIKGLLECWKVCQTFRASKFSHSNVLYQSHLLLSKNDIHQPLPYIFKRQPSTAHQLSLLVQINEGLYFCSPRLATRFESNAANIAKVLVKALLNLIIKSNIQAKSGGEKQSKSYFLRFFFKNSSSK